MMICVFYYFFVGKFGNSKKRATFAPQLQNNCPDGGIGRRAGLKHQWSKIHPGSTPGLGTKRKAKYLTSTYLAFLFVRFFPTFSPQVQNKWL